MKHLELDDEARRLQSLVNQEIQREWSKWSPLAYEQMVKRVADKYLGEAWDYTLLTSLGQPAQVVITQYNFYVEDDE